MTQVDLVANVPSWMLYYCIELGMSTVELDSALRCCATHHHRGVDGQEKRSLASYLYLRHGSLHNISAHHINILYTESIFSNVINFDDDIVEQMTHDHARAICYNQFDVDVYFAARNFGMSLDELKELWGSMGHSKAELRDYMRLRERAYSADFLSEMLEQGLGMGTLFSLHQMGLKTTTHIHRMLRFVDEFGYSSASNVAMWYLTLHELGLSYKYILNRLAEPTTLQDYIRLRKSGLSDAKAQEVLQDPEVLRAIVST